MGRGGWKSQNQKFRVSKIRNLGYKSGERLPERKLRTNLSSRWSWWSESSANRSPMVALRSPYTALFSHCCQRRGGCNGGGEAGMASDDVVASGDVDGGEASMCMAREEGREEESLS
ncbi:hypothetical protein DEO72_LG1g2946 [Vigna unguiculata]|uniref:Uncharacterized protein n=1 Tax=Vigna unguiculata TaxID=3917 RepID=A0A4D6KTZ8_VIGUN|nr:hypothetical protein DEO72_LG1g2946 [Vigna unguiculata]